MMISSYIHIQIVPNNNKFKILTTSNGGCYGMNTETPFLNKRDGVLFFFVDFVLI
jgi:hypothetical protein